MNKFFVFIFCLFIGSQVYTQTYTVSGKIAEFNREEEEGIPYSHVFLYKGDSVIKATSTDLWGSYLLKDVPEGNYKLKAFAYSYSIHVSNLTIKNDIKDYNVELYKQRLVSFKPKVGYAVNFESFDIYNDFIEARATYKALVVSKESRKAVTGHKIDIKQADKFITSVSTDSLGYFLIPEEIKLDSFQLYIQMNDTIIIKNAAVNVEQSNHWDLIIIE